MEFPDKNKTNKNYSLGNFYFIHKKKTPSPFSWFVWQCVFVVVFRVAEKSETKNKNLI